MSKTYYIVKFAVMGKSNPEYAYFDNKSDADKLSVHDFCDQPTRHTVTRPDTIAAYNQLVKETPTTLAHYHMI